MSEEWRYIPRDQSDTGSSNSTLGRQLVGQKQAGSAKNKTMASQGVHIQTTW